MYYLLCYDVVRISGTNVSIQNVSISGGYFRRSISDNTYERFKFSLEGSLFP